MRLSDAPQVRVGDTLASPNTSPPHRPAKVKEVWVNHDRTLVRFLVTGFKDWVSPDQFLRVPEGWKWHSKFMRWDRMTGEAPWSRLERMRWDDDTDGESLNDREVEHGWQSGE